MLEDKLYCGSQNVDQVADIYNYILSARQQFDRTMSLVEPAEERIKVTTATALQVTGRLISEQL